VNAKPIFEKSVELYKKEQLSHCIAWGQDQAEMMLAKCQWLFINLPADKIQILN
jgi:hypothetical protein